MSIHILQVQVPGRIAGGGRIFGVFDNPVDGTIIKVRYDSDDPCAIGAQFDLKVNGSSIYPTFGDRPAMNDGDFFVEQVESEVTSKGDRIELSATLTGSFGSVGQKLYANVYIDDGITSNLPPGGSTGQVLTKLSGADADVDWDNVSGTSSALDDLSDVTAPSPSNDDILQRKAGVWVNRTLAQLMSDMGLTDAMVFKGVIDCSANPNYPAADAGHQYKISVAGKIGGGSGPNVEVNDSIYCITDSTSSGTHGSVGANWVIVQANVDSPVTTAGVQTLTNKRITARIGTTASSSTPTPDADAHDEYTVTALAAGATFGAPSGTPTDGQPLIIRIKDNGGTQTLAYNGIYRAVGVTLPTATVASKTLYLGMIYNNTDSKWDVLAVRQEA